MFQAVEGSRQPPQRQMQEVTQKLVWKSQRAKPGLQKYRDKDGVTRTLKDLKIVVSQKQELGVEKGEEASCWTLDADVGRNEKKKSRKRKTKYGKIPLPALFQVRHTMGFKGRAYYLLDLWTLGFLVHK